MRVRVARWVCGLVLAAAFCSLSGRAIAQQPTKFGIVDLERCLSESKVGKKYEAELSAKKEQGQAELDKKEAILKELREALEKQGLVLSPAAKADKEKEYREKVDAFKEQFKALNQALQRQQQEVTGRVLKDLQGIIREVAEAGGLDLILERREGGVLYSRKETDVTDDVIRRYDQKAKGD